jgi:hypothetical protein
VDISGISANLDSMGVDHGVSLQPKIFLIILPFGYFLEHK